MFTKVKTPKELDAMRESGRMLASVLGFLRPQVVPGLTTKTIADLAAKELRSLGGSAPFLGYHGFPDVICISVNDEVVHGIPSHRKVIQEGDIVSLDFGVKYEGMITDSAISLIVGTPLSAKDVQLVQTTERSMMAGIGAVHNGVRTGDIGAAVEAVLSKGSYGIVRDLVGHGVGHELHEAPDIPNYGHIHTGSMLSAGMTIAIEPMATLGTADVYVAEDKWTILTQDGSRAAHFEHTVAVTEDGAEIITTL